MYRRVLERDPGHAFALTNLGTLLLLARGDDEGIERRSRKSHWMRARHRAMSSTSATALERTKGYPQICCSNIFVIFTAIQKQNY